MTKEEQADAARKARAMVAEIRAIAGEGDPIVIEAAMRRNMAPGHERVTALWDAARDLWWQIATQYRRVAMAEARRVRSPLPFDDIQQEAMIGLYEAARRWDPDRGPFATMVGWWVRKSVYRAANAGAHDIRIPEHVRDAVRRAAQYRISERAAGRHVPVSAVAELVGLSAAQLTAAIAATRGCGLDDPRDGDLSTPTHDRAEEVWREVECLSPAMRACIRARLSGATHDEIAERTRTSRGFVQRLEQRAIRVLRDRLSPHSGVVGAVRSGGSTTADVAVALGRIGFAEAQRRLKRAQDAGLVVKAGRLWFSTEGANP